MLIHNLKTGKITWQTKTDEEMQQKGNSITARDFKVFYDIDISQPQQLDLNDALMQVNLEISDEVKNGFINQAFSMESKYLSPEFITMYINTAVFSASTEELPLPAIYSMASITSQYNTGLGISTKQTHYNLPSIGGEKQEFYVLTTSNGSPQYIAVSGSTVETKKIAFGYVTDGTLFYIETNSLSTDANTSTVALQVGQLYMLENVDPMNIRFDIAPTSMTSFEYLKAVIMSNEAFTFI